MKSSKVKPNLNVTLGSISLTDKALFTKHLAVLLEAGMTFSEAIDITVEQAKGRLRRVLIDLRDKIVAGKSFSEALAFHPKIFSSLYINVIRVGEEGGTLVESLKQLTAQLEKERELRTKIAQALLYPVIVLLALILVGTGASIFVLPKLKSLFEVFQGDLPLATKILLWIVDLFSNYGIFILLGLVFLVVLLAWLFRTKVMKLVWHALILKLPIVGLIAKNINLARFNRNLGTLLKSGLPIAECLSIVANIATNEVYKKHILQIQKEIQKGKDINFVMRGMERVFPRIASRMIRVGEKSGKLDEVLIYLAKFYETEVDKSSKNLSTVLEPTLLIIIGLVVGFVVIAIITPIYQLTSAIGR
jgi:type II secretory pathway component PulF